MRNKKVKKRNKNQENKDLSHFFKTLIIRVLFFYLHFFLFLLELEHKRSLLQQGEKRHPADSQM